MYSVCDTLAGGFPHSEISGSKVICHLPEAYRRLSRLSSPIIAKASTTCSYSLDPITLMPPKEAPQPQHSRNSCQVSHLTRLPYSTRFETQNFKIEFALTQSKVADGTVSILSDHSFRRQQIRLYEFLKNSRGSLDPVIGQNQYPNTAHSTWILNLQGCLVEDDGIEPTTPCLQSRCSPS